MRQYFILTFTGCGKSNDDKGTLNLFMWTEYLPESVITGFEEETGIDVKMQTYSNNEEMIAKDTGSTDGPTISCVPSDSMVET
jgi:spermidine/putrescine-binding protein